MIQKEMGKVKIDLVKYILQNNDLISHLDSTFTHTHTYIYI